MLRGLLADLFELGSRLRVALGRRLLLLLELRLRGGVAFGGLLARLLQLRLRGLRGGVGLLGRGRRLLRLLRGLSGLAADRLIAVGRGEEQPIATNKTAAGRQQNRRVELVITE